jgi:hypothetical protein
MVMLLWVVLQFTPARTPGAILEGHWQSCRENNEWTETAYEHRVLGKQDWEFHFGPQDEFALFAGAPVNHIDHDSPANLLAPAFHINDVGTWHNKRNWNIPRLGLWVSIVAAGGSREECESFFVLIKKGS